MPADVVVVGAGISGSVIAERYAAIGKKVLVLEKRDHIGGNCYDYYNADGIQVSKYGAHLFHTNYEDVWKYVNRFSRWRPYEHRVKALVKGKLVPVPVNISTVNTLFDEQIKNEHEMRKWLNNHRLNIKHPQNGEEAAMARVGVDLYNLIFKNYTKKQWDKYPEQLDALVLNRIPVHTTFDDRYFSDKYQALPENGYTALFESMLAHPNITVLLNTDYFNVKQQLKNYDKLFYTGPIDQFFNYRLSSMQKLEYRSIQFVHETLDQEFFQAHAVINYPNDELFTRIVEYKHITGQTHPHTTIVKEFTTDDGEPYYPVPNPQNQKIYHMYQRETLKLKDIYFVGRLANYKY